MHSSPFVRISVSAGLLAALLELLLATCPTHAQFYPIGLGAEKLDVPAGPWQMTRVLDLRTDRSRLGPVRQGFGNEVAFANFTQPLATQLQQLIEAQWPLSKGARPMLMRVFTLALRKDLRASSEHTEAKLVADFLEPQAIALSACCWPWTKLPSAAASP